MATTNSFAKRLLEARLSYSVAVGRQVGQTELALKLKVKPQSWSGWELGRTEPSLETVARIAALLHVDPGWLAFGEWNTTNHVELPPTPPLKPPAELVSTPKKRRKGRR